MGSLSFSCSVFSGVNTARSAVVPLGTFVPLNIRRSCMPPPRGGVQAASVVCGDHPELITYAELHAGCHMGTGPMRSRPICESERLIVWLWLCGPMAGTAE